MTENSPVGAPGLRDLPHLYRDERTLPPVNLMSDPIAGDAMQLLDSLKIVPVWVDADHLVHSARLLMEGHRLPAIAVLDRAGHPIGLLRRERIEDTDADARVGDRAEPIAEILSADATLRDAADAMVRTGRMVLPLMRGEEFRGVVTAMDLLDGLRRSYDPMTGLPWSDELRRWGGERLAAGQEIAVIFIDLDGFGAFNRRYGHVVGDRVLKKVARFLAARIETPGDVLVRYGGDEFAIATLRDRPDADRLAARLVEENSGPGALVESDETITFSVGVDGGKRQTPRDDAHVEATLDDLINLASRRSIANKAHDRRAVAGGGQAVVATAEPTLPLEAEAPSAEIAEPEAAPTAVEASPNPESEFEVVEVRADPDPNSIAHVTLRRAGTIAVGVGMRLGRSFAEAVAYATARAVERAEPDLGVEVVAAESDEANVRVLLRLARGDEATEGGATLPVGSDPADLARMIAETTLRAVAVAAAAPVR